MEGSSNKETKVSHTFIHLIWSIITFTFKDKDSDAFSDTEVGLEQVDEDNNNY